MAHLMEGGPKEIYQEHQGGAIQSIPLLFVPQYPVMQPKRNYGTGPNGRH